MRALIAVCPDVGREEFEDGLEAVIQHEGGQVLVRLDHPGGAVFPALAQALAAHPQAVAFVHFQPPAIGAAAPSSVLHLHGETLAFAPGQLSLPLSSAFGGWSLVLRSDRQREEHGVAIGYAGCRVEDRDGLGEADATEAFAAAHRDIAGGDDTDMRWSDDIEVRSWIVGPGASPSRASAPLRRMAFLDTDAARVRAALAAAPSATVRLTERAAPITQTPYVLVDGELDDAAFTALAHALDVPATAVRLDADGRFTWCELRPGRPARAGSAQGAAALAQAWGALTVMVGEPASMLRWAR